MNNLIPKCWALEHYSSPRSPRTNVIYSKHGPEVTFYLGIYLLNADDLALDPSELACMLLVQIDSP
jgi:hypothetical protein